MSCSTTFFNRAALSGVILTLLLSSGCAFQNRVATSPDVVESRMPDVAAASEIDRCASADELPPPPLSKKMLIAVLPVDNLSAVAAPLEDTTALLRTSLNRNQLLLLEDRILKRFMKRRRIRHSGGIDSRTARAIKEDTGAEAVLITSLETYYDATPPRVSMISRLVSTGELPGIIWMDSIGFSGDESPGVFDLGIIHSVDLLLEKSIETLVTSLANYLPEPTQALPIDPSSPCRGTTEVSVFPRRDPRLDDLPPFPKQKGKRRFRPKSYYRSQVLDHRQRYRVAIIPFLNLSKRRNAGEIMTLDFVNQLLRDELYTVVEPGFVKEKLLKYRIQMSKGPSFAAEDIISSKEILGVDLVLAGTVFDYEDSVGTPKVDFGVNLYEPRSRQIVWSSRSYNNGGDGVFFFDVGRRFTSHALKLEMVRGTFDLLSAH